ncbi:hypothetical protein L3Y21_gp059 [Gordonia phage Rabbitrun]|uniref:Uncharacterized protein n=1 Tax=Gordonia phage Rabbitrun TaxID=2762280 RepID=A0A7G8LIN0_9CAUD|nr:hypothetical protein L3Y21_gp059 [Gordonia phage Rabbitrun]QNJ57102.1 hypothetical protein SEA_RABBITRUN_59 [Gordonia phage Rabbitrun]
MSYKYYVDDDGEFYATDLEGDLNEYDRDSSGDLDWQGVADVPVGELTELLPADQVDTGFQLPETTVYTNDSGSLVIGKVEGDPVGLRSILANTPVSDLDEKVRKLTNELAVYIHLRDYQANVAKVDDELIRKMGDAYLSAASAVPGTVAGMNGPIAEKFLAGIRAALEVARG